MVVKSVKGAKGTAALRRYWERGKGAAKIRWGVPGDFNRCVSHLRKYIRNPKGYCALRHRGAIGVWPGGEAGGRKGRRRR